eukprot:COSAG06_NODE_160_length_21658_cov_6.433462_4_plen_216_part_00
MRLVLLASVSAALLAVAEARNGPTLPLPPPPPREMEWEMEPSPPPPCDTATCTHGSCKNINNNNGYTCCDDGHCSNGASCAAHTGACSNVCQNGGTSNPANGQCTCTGPAAGYQGPTCANPKPCTSPPLPAHSKWSGGACSNKHYHDTCTATCDPGWTGGTKTSESFKCEADGFTGALECKGAPPLAPPRLQVPCPLTAARCPPGAHPLRPAARQ